ncbi:Uncharacterized protein TCM_023383 [Theobroma cacao]|uniref:Uncharacterized protein n=1 Tax=Theobroma cacao TaxID=3641 RepID=A0A061EVB6_THECC|nr:Uncharacterized protein TCM_023383 [Theobroma cacao]
MMTSYKAGRRAVPVNLTRVSAPLKPTRSKKSTKKQQKMRGRTEDPSGIFSHLPIPTAQTMFVVRSFPRFNPSCLLP